MSSVSFILKQPQKVVWVTSACTQTHAHSVNGPSDWHPNGPSWPSASETGIKTHTHTYVHTWWSCIVFRDTVRLLPLFILHTFPVFVHIWGRSLSQRSITCVYLRDGESRHLQGGGAFWSRAVSRGSKQGEWGWYLSRKEVTMRDVVS